MQRSGPANPVPKWSLGTRKWPKWRRRFALSGEAGQTSHSGSAKMKTDYLKFVKWSNEDDLYIGYCPDLFIGGACHGRDERKVYAELCRLVANDLQRRKREKQPLPRREAIVAMHLAV
jgi:hypothetical protein